MVKVFVYGTLKPGESNYQRYCGDRVITKVPAIVPGKLFALPFGYPALLWEERRDFSNLEMEQEVPDPQEICNIPAIYNQPNWVHGYLLTFANSQSLGQLDALESYHPDRTPTANEYQRLEMEIFSWDRSQPDNLPIATNSGFTSASLPRENPGSLGTAWVYAMSRERIARSRGVFLPQGFWSRDFAKGSPDPLPTFEIETQPRSD